MELNELEQGREGAPGSNGNIKEVCKKSLEKKSMLQFTV
jgi:hypothetical protein